MWTLNARGKLLTVSGPVVMGILNVTEDSFYDGSRVIDADDAVSRAGALLAEGADWLDIGGQSTRPGAAEVGEEEEIRRVVPVIGRVREQWPSAVISVDTWDARVAREAVKAGASIINDVSGGFRDAGMLAEVRRLRVPFICMHMRGTPATMNTEAQYEDVVREVLDYFSGRLEACRQAGVHDVILDPGWGFAKTPMHNFQLLQGLSVLRMCGRPLMLGLSRKSTIYKTLGVEAAQALNGTTVLHTIGLLNGADILRVHDPREAKEVVKLVGAYREAGAVERG
jgi:dihydropteroate synthase